MPPSIFERLLVLRQCAILFILSAAVLSSVHAAALGDLAVQSHLGQPLQAEIKLVAVTPAESAELLARLASPDAFRRANVPFDPLVGSLKFGVMQRDGEYFVTISSEQPMETLTVSLLLELSSGSSRLMREYTLFIDPSQPGGQPDNQQRAARPMMASAEQSSALFRVTGAALPDSPFVPQVATDILMPEKVAYKIRSDDFLGGIASRFKADDISLYQMMVAIFKSNRSAFVDNNINRMRVGMTLMIPDEATVRSINQSEARSLVIQQGKAYRSGVLDAPDDDRWQPYPR